MSKICTFFGHRDIYEDREEVIYNKLYEEVEKAILKGFDEFWLGGRGDFDSIALSVCKNLREKYKHIELYLVLSSFNLLKKKLGESYFDYIKDMKTLYLDTEEVFYMNKITERNKQMAESADLIICYVNFSQRRSGAKKAVLHAQKCGKEIINLYKEKPEEKYTREELKKKIEECLKKY